MQDDLAAAGDAEPDHEPVLARLEADGLSARHPSNGGFTESPPESLAWDFRRDRLVAEVFRHFEEEAGPDVVAMQEVDHYDELAAEMRDPGCGVDLP